ncbi:hypothetical protein KIN20_011826 [Parelaphostrongylus tenuis]|uniref:Uncharacterized protein n=1 Tax=Parelaphostrongylus tenuis TaxID=148309 RepID=A0AAD5QMB6_PARTN|nr:hypothetical protein KIN20_011826 [Parelaphostrongylus tenuis]
MPKWMVKSHSQKLERMYCLKLLTSLQPGKSITRIQHIQMDELSFTYLFFVATPSPFAVPMKKERPRDRQKEEAEYLPVAKLRDGTHNLYWKGDQIAAIIHHAAMAPVIPSLESAENNVQIVNLRNPIMTSMMILPDFGLNTNDVRYLKMNSVIRGNGPNRLKYLDLEGRWNLSGNSVPYITSAFKHLENLNYARIPFEDITDQPLNAIGMIGWTPTSQPVKGESKTRDQNDFQVAPNFPMEKMTNESFETLKVDDLHSKHENTNEENVERALIIMISTVVITFSLVVRVTSFVLDSTVEKKTAKFRLPVSVIADDDVPESPRENMPHRSAGYGMLLL